MPKINPADLQVNRTFEANSPDTTLIVEVAPQKRLRVGAYAFQLQVTDDANNVSAPDTVTLRIVDDTAPTAVITAPATVSVGKPFTLSGERSFDADDGRIVKFKWTMISGPAPGGPIGGIPIGGGVPIGDVPIGDVPRR